MRLIVVDNASAVALPELGEDSEVVRSERRLSLGAARNLGLQRVQTPYVLFWDADDTMLPRTLPFLESAIEADPRLAAFGAAILEASGGRHRWPRPWIARLTSARTLFALVDCVWSLYPSTGATIMRTEQVRTAGGYFDAESGEDWCLGVSLAWRGQIGWSERPGRIYSLDDRSVWARHMTARHLVAHARNVRARVASDRGIPGWVRTSLPLVALMQLTAIAAHTVVATLRGARR
jgi:glycosyltransferase involved in cell wall biosynthesis